MDTTGTFRTLHDRELSGRKAWNLKKAEIVPLIVGPTEIIKKTLTESLKIIPGNITPN